jgi:hypothetical protein
MIKFSRIQSILVWFHIPMWIATGIVIVIIGAYHAGVKKDQVNRATTSALMQTLPIMSLRQLTQIKVNDI